MVLSFTLNLIVFTVKLAGHRVQRRMISVDNFFVFFEMIIFCFVVAI